MLDGGVKGRMSDHDEGGGRNDLLDVRVPRIPSLHFVFGGLPDVHAGIEAKRLDDERSGLWRDPKALFLPYFHAFDECENVGDPGRHVLILFYRPKAVKAGKIFPRRGILFPTGNKPDPPGEVQRRPRVGFLSAVS